MSDGTEQDGSGPAGGGGGPTVDLDAPVDPVWPVWGEAAQPSDDAAEQAPESPVPDAVVEPTPEPSVSDATVEPTPEPSVSDATVEPEPSTEPSVSDAIVEPEPSPEAPAPEAAVESELTPEARLAAADAAVDPEPEPSVPDATDAEPEAEGEPEPVPVLVPAAEDRTEVLAPVAAAPVVERVSTKPAPPSSATAPVVTDPDPAPTAVVPPVAEPTPATTPTPAGAFAPVTAAAAAATGTIQAGRVPSSERTPSPFDVFEPEDRRRRWPRRLLVVGGVVLVLCAAYVVASFALDDTVPRGASVAGVDIGGLKSAAAVARLDSELADQTTKPIPVVAQDAQATLDPAAAGLTFDAQATVDAMTGTDLANPKQLWDHIVGVGAQQPVTAVDSAKLAAAVDGLGSALQLLPVDGTIVFVDATAQSTAAVDGWDLDAKGAAKVVAHDWLVAARPLKLPTTAVPAAITQEKTDAALTEATKVTSAPVSVSVDGQVALLDAKTLAANTAYVPTNGDLVRQLNGDGLTTAVVAQLPGLLQPSADAHFEFVNDAPTIVPGTPGTTLDPKAVAAAVSTAAVSDNRTATVALTQADPTQSTAALEALGIKEIVSEFDTPLTSEPKRTVNITNGAGKISGTLVKPGETFSLTDALGPLDAAHGFVEAGAIVSGEHTDAWGGGLSQVSTTTYNAAYLAGFEDIEHKPHSEWFARYPEGREATIFTGTLDMRWKNNTPYGALIQAWVANNRVYVQIWGTKYWTVESTTSPRSNVVQPTTVYSQSPTCEASAAGNPGFKVTVTRKTSLNGTLVKTESNSWRYNPQNKTICGPAPATPPAG